MTARLAVLDIPLHGAGLCTAAGGFADSIASLAADGASLGPELLDAFDVVGNAVCGLAAAPNVGREDVLHFDSRVMPMLRAAVQDLTLGTELGLADLAAERLFIVIPESAPGSGATLVAEAWMGLHGAEDANARRTLQQRISSHADAAEALAAASASVAFGGKSALVLCCESWLTRAGIARLDDEDLLCCPSSDGILPGEAAVLLRLESQSPRLRCAGLVETEDRHASETPLGSQISEAVLALLGDRRAATVIADAHANQRSLGRESEFLRLRHWAHLPPGDAAWLRGAALGCLGHCAGLLHLAVLSRLPAQALPALGYSRSLWKQGLICSRHE